MKLIFDIEADALLDTVSKIHCLVVQDVDTEEVQTFVGHKDIQQKGLPLLDQAEEISGHNIIGYDLIALKKVLGWTPKAKVFDTLIACKLSNPDIYPLDASMRYRKLEKRLYGSHSLAAWGQRLGNFKAEKPMDFTDFNPEMLTYCVQDVSTNLSVYKYLRELNMPELCLQIEHEFWQNTIDMEENGFPFDIPKATALHGKLAEEREKIRSELVTLFPTRVIERVSEKTGKALKPKIIEFNPSSRDHIAYWFKTKYNWVPKDLTPSGKPEVNADILESLDYPEAAELKRYFVIDKIIGMIAEGKGAWLTLVGKDGRMHGKINTIGAATTRCTHSLPNLAQVPSVRKPYGEDCRSFFHAPKGYKQVGTDLNAIELRCFAHYLGAYDNNEYSNLILTGDIHWANAVAAGFHEPGDYDETNPDMKAARNKAKTLIYALIYGAGDNKLGDIVGGGSKEGKAIRKKLYENFPAIEKLTEDVKKAAEGRGYIKLLHGAKVPLRKAFAALNTLLQGAGAVVAKEWLNTAKRMCDERGWILGKDYWFAAHIHDEIAAIVKENLAKDFAKVMEASATKAGETLGMRCKVEAEAKIGSNWAETH